MKATLGGLEAARKGPGLVQRVQEAPHNRINATPFVKPFQLPSDMLEEVLTSSSYSRFTVVRDPASRVLSGYLEKIGQGLKQSEPIVAALGIPASEITFAQFLDVIAAQDSREQDPHWRRQADHVGWGIVELQRRDPLGEFGCIVGPGWRVDRHHGLARDVLLP